MTCRLYRETLLDIARGVAMAAAVARDAEAHAAGCAACRRELERQRDLTVGLGTLRDEASAWSVSSSLEQRLLQAVEAERLAAIRLAPAGRVTPLWWSAAAAAVLIIGVGLGVRDQRETRDQQAGLVNRGAPARPVPANDVNLPRPERDASSGERAVRPTSPVRNYAAAARNDTARTIEFLTLPTAIGLPRMESARIVRMELPVSALPAYGVAIAPDAPRTPVQAEFLIGQDGQARGIRLVSARQE